MAIGPENPAWQRSRRSSPSKGKLCTWRRAAGNQPIQIKERCVRHYEKSCKCIGKSKIQSVQLRVSL
ncbi:hypothetical protein DW651_20940 [Subdoligranulum sp. AM23-21AC]|nr:hypothetical protein DW651_20940 [Subdoligranulum sp. AM23-21AC]RJW21609.1 hypothetical protein DXC43_18725 [Subdoligranulum sp. TF05-17AC]